LIGQFELSSSAIYSESLFRFNKNNYCDGWGGKFGLGYTYSEPNKTGIEIGFNWIFSENGNKETKLPIGDYTLSNNWYNWQFNVNTLFEFKKFKHYFGINVGKSTYYTTEYLSFAFTQDDNTTYWRESIMKNNVFQFGFQLGTYIEITDGFSFDFGLSILKGTQPVDFINFESFTYDGELIDYQEKRSSPFLFTINAGFKINLSKLKLGSELCCGSNDYLRNSNHTSSQRRRRCTKIKESKLLKDQFQQTRLIIGTLIFQEIHLNQQVQKDLNLNPNFIKMEKHR
jgi:hypothetical protein